MDLRSLVARGLTLEPTSGGDPGIDVVGDGLVEHPQGLSDGQRVPPRLGDECQGGDRVPTTGKPRFDECGLERAPGDPGWFRG